MTALQIFGAILIIALISGWVIIADALRNTPKQPEDESTKDCGGYWD
jgi:hypothetical protein